MNKKTLAPPSGDDLMRVVATRLPEPVVELVDKIGRRQMRSRADAIRTLVVEALEVRGLVERAEAV